MPNRRALIGLVCAGLSLAIVAPAASDTQATFSFADTTPLTTSCADLVSGVAVTVRNDTATQQTVVVRVGTFVDGGGAARPADSVCGGVRASAPQPATVLPGDDAVVTLRATSTPPNGTQTFTGTLAVFGESGLVSRRSLTIAEKKTTAAPPLPAIDSRDVTHEHRNPTDDWTVWVPVKLPAGVSPNLTPGDRLGVLTGEGGSTKVTYAHAEPKAFAEGVQLVPLHVDRTGAGTYTGKVDLTPNDTTTGVVSLSLTVKDWWLLAVLAVLGGIALALVVQLLNGYKLTRDQLLERVGDLETLRVEAQARLRTAAGSRRWKSFDVEAQDLALRQADLRAEITRGTPFQWVTIDQKVVDDLTGKIDAVARQIGALDDIAKSAPLLARALDELRTNRPGELPPRHGSDRRVPRFASDAKKLLRGSPLPAADLAERSAEIAAAVAAVHALKDDERALGHYWRLAAELGNVFANGGLKGEVAALKSALEGIAHALWDADSAKLVDEAADGFHDVREKINELWPHLPSPPPRHHVRAGDSGAVPDELVAAAVVLPRRYTLDVRDRAAAVVPPPRPEPLSQADVERILATGRITQWAVLLLAVATALATALPVLYVGKPWGSVWDYVAAVAWGSVTQGVLTGITAALGGLGALGAFRKTVGRAQLSPR